MAHHSLRVVSIKKQKKKCLGRRTRTEIFECHADITQLVECSSDTRVVVSSNLAIRTKCNGSSIGRTASYASDKQAPKCWFESNPLLYMGLQLSRESATFAPWRSSVRSRLVPPQKCLLTQVGEEESLLNSQVELNRRIGSSPIVDAINAVCPGGEGAVLKTVGRKRLVGSNPMYCAMGVYSSKDEGQSVKLLSVGWLGSIPRTPTILF